MIQQNKPPKPQGPISGRATLFGSTSLTSESGVGIPIIIEATGELKVVNYGKAGSTITAFATETSGEQKNVVYGKASGTVTAIKVRATGEQDYMVNGTDEAGNIDTFRTDPNRIQWVRHYDGYVFIDGAAVPSSEGILLDGSAVLTAAGLYAVEFLIVNIDGAASVDVTVGRDNDAGGSLAAAEYWMFTEAVAQDSNSGWRGPFLMNGDDDVRGLASAADDAVIQFRVRRVDVGA